MLFDKNSVCDRNQAIVVSSENGNRHILYNQSLCGVFQYHIDGGINQTGRGERCDYIVEAEKRPQPYAYIIELKGSDLNKAVSQIQQTITDYQAKLKGYLILPRIIIHKTSTHDIQGTKYRKLKKLFPETVVRSRIYDEDRV